MESMTHVDRRWTRWTAGLTALISVLLWACGAATTPTSQTPATVQAVLPTPALGPDGKPVPTATLRPAPTQAPVTQARDSIVLVVQQEPDVLNAFAAACTASPDVFPCGDYSTDTLTYIDGNTFQVVPLSGTERWEQTAPDRWRFWLRQGVKFHNGEPFNAEAAKFAIDFEGDAGNGHLSHSYTGVVRAEVVDDYTVDVVCQLACPIYPRTAFFTRFQAPAWYKGASEAERVGSTIGFGPYRLKEWRRGEYIKMTAYEGYLARTDVAEAQMPRIKEVTQLHRSEATVRAAMVRAGEAQWAFEVGFENAQLVPVAKVGGAAELAVLKVDTLWNPVLKKKEVRQALVHAMDCQTMVQSLYGGRVSCTGNSAPAGTLGLTPENARPFEYSPAKAKALLEQAGYKGEEIKLRTQIGRFYRDVELSEAIVGYWREAGINAKVEALELGIHSDLGRTGCGQYKDRPLECMNLPPPPPGNTSPQVITSTPSLETLDFAKIAIQTLSCYSIRSFVCEPDRLEPLITQAVAATGEQRKALMEQIATILHDDVLIIGLFELVVVYGVDKDLIWEPRYDRRVRLNMMSFAR